MEYPKVKHKLHELFDIIIDVDKYRELLRKLSVIPLDDVRQNKLRRQELTRAAEEYVKRQKGPSGGAV